MSKKTRRAQKPKMSSKGENTVFFMTSEEATLAGKPRYNGFGGGYGVHGDTKYNRRKEKKDFRKFLDES